MRELEFFGGSVGGRGKIAGGEASPIRMPTLVLQASDVFPWAPVSYFG